MSFEPIDSSNVKPDMWVRLASIIRDRYDEFDGFVILHGTDTMSYSASALSFMLEDQDKPVIFTGSQIPIGVMRTDGRENLITAIEIAAARINGEPAVPEVGLYFQNRLFRANRTTKYSAEELDAFRSDNYPALADVGVNIHYNTNYIRRPNGKGKLKVHTDLESRIIVVKLFPGLTEGIFTAMIDIEGVRGVVLETYGSGNAPTEKWFLDVLSSAISRGIPNIANDPAVVAFRLNILLATAQDKSVANIYDVTVDVDGTAVNLKELLFSKNLVEETGAGVWKITYIESNKASGDYKRIGTIVVNTGGKLLGELDYDEHWDISIEDGSYAWIYTDSYSNSYSYDIELPNSYTITCNGIGMWNLYSAGIKSVRSNSSNAKAGNWIIDYNIGFSYPMTYENVKKYEILVGGSAEGTVVDTEQLLFTHMIQSNLKFTNDCSTGTLLVGGIERVECAELPDLYPDLYPSGTVKIKWKSSGSCENMYVISYNGYARDSNGTEVTPDF
ncbi:l-asparaginase [Holotrichia oblita]|uniref:L-asparaginase n=1 Tax=Holotrichia oblita TaxID=644536 RepID=A0ACB9TR42_HOLOL|nr:l-asparaginase [Holotrichia oblita]